MKRWLTLVLLVVLCCGLVGAAIAESPYDFLVTRESDEPIIEYPMIWYAWDRAEWSYMPFIWDLWDAFKPFKLPIYGPKFEIGEICYL